MIEPPSPPRVRSPELLFVMSAEGYEDNSKYSNRDPSFYSDHIVFKVGNQLFKVPRRKFERDSEIFRDMFALPAGEGIAEGLSDGHPLLLEGILLDEFRAFLQVMFRPYYGPTYAEAIDLTLDKWIHVLKLTTMWQFARLRCAAIDCMTPLLKNADPVLWVELARKYDVYEWLFPALHALAKRVQPMQVSEVEPLGIVTVVKMAEVRESYVGGNASLQRHYVSSRSDYDFGAIIRKVFKEELREVDDLPWLS